MTPLRFVRRSLGLVVLVGPIIVACDSGPAPRSPVPTGAAQIAAPRCPPRQFDARAPLGPEFDSDAFARDESRTIAQSFLDELAALYADPQSADICRLFTANGWRTALESDWRLRAVARGELVLEQSHLLRFRNEGNYDLRDRPPLVPLDIIFDIPAGSSVRDLVSGETRRGASDERVGFHVDLTFDGHQWRVDSLGPIGADFRQLVVFPAAPLPGPPCLGLVRDGDEPAFDANADRPWCDADGRGRTIRRGEQYVLFTRYPCEIGHAAILGVGRPLGAALDTLVRWEYVRDPAGEFMAQGWLTEPYDGDATMPADAAYSGWTNGNVDLWISPSELDRAVYVMRDSTVERWPRAVEFWGVVDCN